MCKHNYLKTHWYGLLMLPVSLFLLSLFWDIYEPSIITNEMTEELNSALIDVAIIDTFDNCNPNYPFLKDVLSNKRIVLLGEQFHNDGATLHEKCKLTRYLIDSLGYTIILFEDSFFDLWIMNELMKETDTISPDIALQWYWGEVKEMDCLWSHINNPQYSKKQPITIGGIGPSICSGNMDEDFRRKMIANYFENMGESFDQFACFNSIGDNMRWLATSFHSYFFSNDEKKSIINDLEHMLEIIIDSRITNDNEKDPYYRFLSGYKEWIKCSWAFDYESKKYFEIYDSLCAENLTWWLHNHPSERIVLWTRNDQAIQSCKDDFFREKTISERMHDIMHDSIYTICFSSYCRLNKNSGMYRKGSNLSLENQIHSLAYNRVFIDFCNIDSSSLLKGKIWTRVYHDKDIYSCWSNMIDGYYYIDINYEITKQK